MRSLALLTEGMIYSDALDPALTLQSIGIIYDEAQVSVGDDDTDDAGIGQAAAGEGNVGGMNLGIPWELPAYAPTPSPSSNDVQIIDESQLVKIDENRIAARAFAEGLSEVLAVELAVLIKKKDE